VFSPELLSWRPENFAERVYNERYAEVDPDSTGARARASARFLADAFGEDRHRIDHLDFGGGSGLMSRLLVQEGWRSTSYDPFLAGQGEPAGVRPGRYNLITAFEVMEHVPQPNELIDQLRRYMDDDGMILFSTLLSDGHIVPGRRLTWWYVSPRNGHISLFSRASLSRLARRHGLVFGSLHDGLHYFLIRRPEWAARLLP
jgi:2-polyprenyl-3-methyl-5-hydroxy-6-metoxy-1,4-benzoquinol methylase